MLSLPKSLPFLSSEQSRVHHLLKHVLRRFPLRRMRWIEGLLEWPKRVPVPMGSRVVELGDLLPESSQNEDLSLWMESQSDSIKVAALVAQVQEVSLVKDAKLLIRTQVRHPLCRFGTSVPMVLVIKEVMIAIPLTRHRMDMTGFTADGHGYFPKDCVSVVLALSLFILHEMIPILRVWRRSWTIRSRIRCFFEKRGFDGVVTADETC